MTKVCHVTSAHPPRDVRIFRKECSSLARAGYDVYLVEQGDSGEENGVHLVGVGRPSGRLNRMTGFARRVYRAALAVDAEIYHLHDPELLPWGMKLKRRGKKVIFDSHERYSEMLKHKPYLPEWCTRIIAAVYTRYERYVFKRLDGVIFPCLKDGRHPFEGMCPRVATVNNVAMLEELYDKYDPDHPKWEESLIYVGELSHERGVTHTVLAAEQSGAVAYFGGGFSDPDYRAKLEAMPEYACARFLGRLDRQQVLDTLQSCRIGMANLLNVGQYNQYDNLPTKVYEYMSLGLPTILTRAPYNEAVAAEYGFGICVDPENVEETARAIRYLLDNPEEAGRMGENGRRAIREKFNWTLEQENLLALYRDILA